ncbi:MAG: BACON domain-containing protein [Bacteroidales bacterium]|nr:BACON domain-containing protein [Bacteroidales bacterium]
MQYRILPFLALSALLAGGCRQTEKERTSPSYFLVDGSGAASVSAEQQGVVVPVSVDMDWTASLSDESWCTLLTDKTDGGGTVTLQVLLNNALTERSLTLTLKAGDATEQVELVQQGLPSVVSATSVALTGTQEQALTLHTRGGWDLAGVLPDWLRAGATGGVAGSSRLTLAAVDDNREGEIRSCDLPLRLAGGTVLIHVSQGQTDALDLSETAFSLTGDGGTFEVTVGANVDYSVDVSADAASWISHVSTRAYTQQVETFSVAANESEEPREGTVTFRSGDLFATVSVRQEGAARFKGDPYQVGLYNYKGRNYLYTEGSDQYALTPSGDGTHTLNILTLNALKVISIGGIPNSPVVGASLSIPLLMVENGAVTAEETLTGTVSQVQEGFVWITVPGNRRIIAK